MQTPHSSDRKLVAKLDGSEKVIPVLFIAGASRSGSTLLDRVIGMYDGFCSMGELHFLWERSFAQNQLCGCGTPFHDCPFWEQVAESAFGTSTSEFDYQRAVDLKRAIGWKRFLLRGGPFLGARGPAGRAMQSYTDLLADLYLGILRSTGERVIIDSSKDPVHGFLLARNPRFAVHVVHLVRDPRAVSFSLRRSRKRPEIHWTDAEMPKESIYLSTTRWLGLNALVELLGRSATSYVRVRYEDLLVTPEQALKKIFTPYEWMSDRLRSLDDVAVDLPPAHTASGNPMRFKRGRVELKIDLEWEKAMSARDRRMVLAGAWPLMLRYGYSLR